MARIESSLMSEYDFIENSNKTGIQNFDYKENSNYRRILQKAVLDKNKEPLHNTKPSWIFFEEMTGMDIMIKRPENAKEAPEVDEYYDNTISAIDNIKKAIADGKIAETSVLKDKTEEELDDFLLEEQQKFIDTRTTPAYQANPIVNLNPMKGYGAVSDDIPEDGEKSEVMIVNNLFFFVRSIIKNYKQKESPNADFDSNEFKSSVSSAMPISSANLMGALYGKQWKVNAKHLAVKDDNTGEDITQLGVLKASKTLVGKIKSARQDVNGDTHLDYLDLVFKYDTGQDKGEQARNVSIVKYGGKDLITEEDYHELFLTSIGAKYKFSIFTPIPLGKIISHAKNGLTKFLQEKGIELDGTSEQIAGLLLADDTLDKYEDAVALMNLIKESKAGIGDIMDEVDSSLSTDNSVV